MSFEPVPGPEFKNGNRQAGDDSHPALARKAEASIKSRENEVVRKWLAAVIDDLDLASLKAFPARKFTTAFPRLIDSMAQAIREPSAYSGRQAELAEAAACLAGMRKERPDVTRLVDDYALLKRLLLEAVSRDLRNSDVAALTVWQRLDDGFNRVFKLGIEAYFKQRSGELQYLADTDALTGLYNVRYFRRQLHINLEMYKRYRIPFALLMLDLDRFKRLNDSGGRFAGDRVLKCLAAVMLAEKRETDIAVRYGGDEFFLLLPGTLAAEAERLARRISRQARRINIRSGGRDITSVSTGVVSCPADGIDVGSLRAKADRALCLARAMGGGAVACYREYGMSEL